MLPGLHDHHVHLYSAAAAETSIRVGPPQVRDRAGLAAALASAEAGEDGWIRAVGYHDSVAGPLDRDALDAMAPAVPLRVQHRSGVLWILNSAGLARVGLAEHPDGRLRSTDSWSDALSPQRDQPGRPQRPAQPLRRHRNHRCHTGSRHRRHRAAVGAAPARRTAPTRALSGPGQTDPARRRPGPRAARRLDRAAAPRRRPGRRPLRHRRPAAGDDRGAARSRLPTRATASSTPPSCRRTAWPIWPTSR